ncbi:MAG: BatA domain-containing protein [Bacteroidales bacterium]|nr:BatA domain-containing protein [Bacteroidales bacterium]
MSFNHPEFLYGLFALLIPIIIHLFNFRRYKKFYFSNIEFLKNITAETRKQNKLKHLVVLLLRLLAILFLVLAFAGPQWGKNGKRQGKSGERLRAVYIDNSFSMRAEGEHGQLFNEAVTSTRELIAQSPRDMRFALLSNEPGSGRNTMNKERMFSTLEELSISPAYRPLSSALWKGLHLVGKKNIGRYELFIYSDFQKNAFDAPDFPTDSLGNYYFIPLKQSRSRNIYIDSCWIPTPVLIPGRPVQLLIRLRNASGEDYEKIPLTVSIDGQQKAVAGVNLKARSTKTVRVSFSAGKAGWHSGLIETEDYPITFDDKFYFSFKLKQNLRVLEVHNGENSKVLQLFYQTDSVFHFVKMNYRQIDYNKLKTFKLIILNSLPSYSSGLLNQLKSYLEQGGTVLFVPGEESELTEKNKFLQSMQAGRILGLDTARSRVVRIKKSDVLFRESVNKIPENAELPTVNKHFRYGYPVSSGLENLVSLLNGDDFLLRKNIGAGQLFLLSVSLDKGFGNFSSQALFVPLMYGVAVTGGVIPRLFYTLDKDEFLTAGLGTVPESETVFSLQQATSGYTFIPEQQSANGDLHLLLRNSKPETDGFYNLRLGDSTWRVFAFNYNRSESQTEYYSPDEIREELNNSGLVNFKVLDSSVNTQTNVINSLQTAGKLWMLFIIFALSILLAEVLVLRFWKG